MAVVIGSMHGWQPWRAASGRGGQKEVVGRAAWGQLLAMVQPVVYGVLLGDHVAGPIAGDVCHGPTCTRAKV